MKRFAFLALSALMLLSAAPRCSAQVVAGLVIDRGTQGHVEGVRVRVVGPGDSLLVETVTNSDGIFFASLSHPATVRLHFGIDGASDFQSDSIVVHADEYVERQFVLDVTKTYYEFQVEKQVRVAPRERGPQYPVELRNRNVEGEVLAQFVVDTTGRALMDSFHALRSTHPLFTLAVRDAVATMHFLPAEVAGRKVRQLTQQPFTFRLTGMPSLATEDHSSPEPFPRDRPRP